MSNEIRQKLVDRLEYKLSGVNLIIERKTGYGYGHEWETEHKGKLEKMIKEIKNKMKEGI